MATKGKGKSAKGKSGGGDDKPPRPELSDNGLKRVAHQAGAKRIDRRTHALQRTGHKAALGEMIHTAIILASNDRRKTVNSEDIKEAVKLRGGRLYGY